MLTSFISAAAAAANPLAAPPSTRSPSPPSAPWSLPASCSTPHRPPLGPRAARSVASPSFSERVSGLPGWARLPLGVAMVALIVALFGMYWDISLHIDNGRDAGPLANPAHYFILVGLFGIFAAGVLAIGLPVGERPGPAAVRITERLVRPGRRRADRRLRRASP